MDNRLARQLCDELSNGYSDQNDFIVALANRLEDTTNALAEFGMVLSKAIQGIEARLDAIEGRNP